MNPENWQNLWFSMKSRDRLPLEVAGGAGMESLKQRTKEPVLVAASFTILTLILTYPGVFNLSTHFMCDGGDGFQNMWNMWWLKTSLLDLHQNPYYTTYLHHPDGVSLLFQTLNPFNGLISIPLQFLFRMEITYNLIVIFSFIMSGIGMYCLARYLIKDRLAAFIAGCIYTFCPFHFAHGLGHLQLIAMEWMPFYILYMIKIHREGGWKNGVLGGVFLILTALCSWYYLIYSGFITLIYLIYHLITKRASILSKDFGRDFLIMSVTFLVFMSPLLGSMLYTKLTQEFVGEHDPEMWSADLTSFFVPSAISTYGRAWFSSIWSKWVGNTAENSNYIGYIVLGLSIFALVKCRDARFWGIVALFAFIMALGPYLRVMGVQYRTIPLPYQLFHRYLPLFSFTGVPERFDIMLKFSLAIISGYAVNWIYNRLGNPRLRAGFAVLVSAFIIMEYLAVPYVQTEVAVSEFYHEMARDEDVYGVIDLPSGAVTLYLATIHRKPLVGGYVSRPSQKALNFLNETPVIKDLMAGGKTESADIAGTAREVFSKYNIRYIITHNDAYRDFIEGQLGLEVHYEDELVRVYSSGV